MVYEPPLIYERQFSGNTAVPKKPQKTRLLTPYLGRFLIKVSQQIKAFAFGQPLQRNLLFLQSIRAMQLAALHPTASWGWTNWARPNTTCPPTAGCANCFLIRRHKKLLPVNLPLSQGWTIGRVEWGHWALLVPVSRWRLIYMMSGTRPTMQCSSNLLNP